MYGYVQYSIQTKPSRYDARPFSIYGNRSQSSVSNQNDVESLRTVFALQRISIQFYTHENTWILYNLTVTIEYIFPLSLSISLVRLSTALRSCISLVNGKNRLPYCVHILAHWIAVFNNRIILWWFSRYSSVSLSPSRALSHAVTQTNSAAK